MIQFIKIHFTFPKFRSVLHNTPIHSLPIWLLMILIDDLLCLPTVAMATFSIQRSIQAHVWLCIACEIGNDSSLTVGRPAMRMGTMNTQLFSNFDPYISKTVSFHFHALTCSNCIATKCLPSRAWDFIFVKWNETLHGLPSHEVIHFVSQCPRVTVYMFIMRPGLLWTAMAPRTCICHTWVSHCAQRSCSYLLFPITRARQGQGSPF